MMTNLGFLLGNPVLDLFHCNITCWEEYRRYRNSFYEFKPKHNNYDFVIPKKDMEVFNKYNQYRSDFLIETYQNKIDSEKNTDKYKDFTKSYN